MISLKRLSGEVIGEGTSFKEIAEQNKSNLRGANLDGAYLRGANLRGANLDGADLTGADLTGAYLRGANLRGANLTGADLRGANLGGAYLTGANLTGANLTGANLTSAQLPSPSVVLLANWGSLPDDITTEAMRYDAFFHEDPGAFDKWAAKGKCPYVSVSYTRACNFIERKELWKTGAPAISGYELMVRIFAATGVKR